MRNVFPERLKKLRKDKGMTQEEVAKLLNIKRSTYGEYERGKILPPIEKVKHLSEILDTDPQYLVGWDSKYDVDLTTINDGFEYSETFLSQSEQLSKAVADKIFTEDELCQIIHFAKYLIYHRDHSE